VTETPILLAVDGAVAVITLNRPDLGNAIDLPMALALQSAVRDCAADDAIRCVVLTGAGRMFCVGGDVAAMAAAGDARPQFLAELIGALNDALVPLMAMQKPLLTLVNGPAAGAGFSLAISGDVVLAAQSASFLAAYGAVGLTADAGMSWLLPRLVGLRQTQRLIHLNQKVGAEEAAQMGLVTQVLPDAELAQAGQAMARRLAASAMASVGGVRALLLASLQNTYADQLALERASMVTAAQSAENAEGIAAFLEKRRPVFGPVFTKASS
jgi:2-(1,2-epoxy-1,2-dihydrophenyl)acetyl-CoA isomerase